MAAPAPPTPRKSQSASLRDARLHDFMLDDGLAIQARFLAGGTNTRPLRPQPPPPPPPPPRTK
ncbi:hypothetical protein HJFPF1_11675 [Paramyrothecium foliicola]|nr:hypothetical protein HJFPF1_11675 [Paramyrothecium foliicola]